MLAVRGGDGFLEKEEGRYHGLLSQNKGMLIDIGVLVAKQSRRAAALRRQRITESASASAALSDGELKWREHTYADITIQRDDECVLLKVRDSREDSAKAQNGSMDILVHFALDTLSDCLRFDAEGAAFSKSLDPILEELSLRLRHALVPVVGGYLPATIKERHVDLDRIEGRIDLAKMMRGGMRKTAPYSCVVQEATFDKPENVLVRAAIDLLWSSPATVAALEESATFFRDVGSVVDRETAVQLFEEISWDESNEHMWPAAVLSDGIVRFCGLHTFGSFPGTLVISPTWRVFEEWIRQELARAVRCDGVYVRPDPVKKEKDWLRADWGRRLFVAQSHEGRFGDTPEWRSCRRVDHGRVEMLPDLLFSRGGSTKDHIAVGDVKFRHMSRPDPKDLNQLTTYVHHARVDLGFLVYFSGPAMNCVKSSGMYEIFSIPLFFDSDFSATNLRCHPRDAVQRLGYFIQSQLQRKMEPPT